MPFASSRAPYGLWQSPISPASLAGGINVPSFEWNADGSLLWVESRPDRSVILAQPPDRQAPRELNSQYSARGRVGYGGGEFTVKDGIVYFVAADSGRIYRQPLAAGLPEPVTPGFGGAAAPQVSPDGRWLLFIRSYEGRDSLEIVDSQGVFWPQKLDQGQDFYMQPAWHPRGELIAWIAWDHPRMPWDGTTLYLGKLQMGAGVLPSLAEKTPLAGGDEIAVFQPQFSPDGRFLAYVSDESGWWQIYLFDLEQGSHRQVTTARAEHGAAAWLQGMRTYDFSPDGKRLFYIRTQGALNTLWELDLESGQENHISPGQGYLTFDQIRCAPSGDSVTVTASGPAQPPRLISVSRSGDVFVHQRFTSEELPGEVCSIPRLIDWQVEGGETVYGIYYPPQNPRYEGAGLPPLIAMAHSGPTSHMRLGFDPKVQFFTSRGYACLQVNYRGSTGYGRDYRSRLRGNWGVYDVEDVVSGVKYLTDLKLVDPGRLVIMGSSAGGFTALKVLEDYPGFFKAGICLYPVANHLSMVGNTHKFELHYSDTLLGPFPEAAKIYYQRSPIFFADRIRDPIAVFQGDQDMVVSQSQADELVASLRRRGVPHLYQVYAGEGHGFRKPETIAHLYSTIEQFLRQYVIFA